MSERNTIPVERLANIGAGIACRLKASGIKNRGDLEKLTPSGAYRRLAQSEPERRLPVCYYLYALDAALKDHDWRELSDKQKKRLRQDAGLH